jgi:hypothetical protein
MSDPLLGPGRPLLGRGLLTTPLRPTVGLPDRQSGGVIRSSEAARSGDRATTGAIEGHGELM